MKALKIILLSLLGLVVLIGVLSFIEPTTLKSERSIVIRASKAAIFEQVRLLANNQKWSPWAERDPNMKTNIAGTDGTVGAIFSWEGNDKVGKGEQTITKIEDQKGVEVKLHFIKPWESEAMSHIMLEDDPGGVKVTWGFDGKMPRPWNVMGLFVNMDKQIGTDFEQGLAKLKDLVEKQTTITGMTGTKTFSIQETTTPPRTYYGVRKEIPFDKISAFFDETMSKVYQQVMSSGGKPAGPPVGLYYTWDEKAMKTDVAIGVPVAGAGSIKSEKFDLKGGKTLVIDYYGAYTDLPAAHNQMNAYIAEKKYKFIPPVIEEYLTDPRTEKDTSKWLTKICYFVE